MKKQTNKYNKQSDRKKADISQKYRSTAHYILSSLIPYTEANLHLAFKPGKFFDNLERIGDAKTKRTTLSSSYYKLVRNGFIDFDSSGKPQLTKVGTEQLKRYEPKILNGAASILVIFDIPEEQRRLRQKLRTLLRELRFEPVQQSVWSSQYDVLDYLVPELKQEHLDEYVQVYESARIV